MDWLSAAVKGLLGFALPMVDKVPGVRAIIGTLLVCFIPGFAWTFVLFKELTHLERVALSFGLSIALVTLSILFANIVLHIRVTGLNSLLTIIFITVIPLTIFYTRKYLNQRGHTHVD